MVDRGRIAAQNRRARFDYFIDRTVEAGVMLSGTEVKSLRAGQASLQDAFAVERSGELWLIGVHINEYAPASRFNHPPKRPRKLLLRKREVSQLLGAAKRDGVTLIPMSIYFTDRGIAKVELGLARGKRKVDKREAIKQRDWSREKSRVMRERT